MSLNLSRLLQGQGGAQPSPDAPQVDTAEQIYISSLALIKMLKHGAFDAAAPCIYAYVIELTANFAS
jgi:hypothetical protein